jgi:hypothetical protein
MMERELARDGFGAVSGVDDTRRAGLSSDRWLGYYIWLPRFFVGTAEVWMPLAMALLGALRSMSLHTLIPTPRA